jgi:hypothetical protein
MYKKPQYINQKEIKIMEESRVNNNHSKEDWFKLLGVLLLRSVTSYQWMLKEESIEALKKIIFIRNSKKLNIESGSVRSKGQDVYPNSQRVRFD